MLRKLQSRLKHAKALYPYLIIIALTMLLLFPQISQHIYLTGTDSWFHMNQYYDAAMQFKTGHFSYFLTLFGFNSVGRIVSALYGPGFMYFNGLLLLAVRTWFRLQMVQNFLLIFGSGTLFYVLARKNKVTTLTSLLLSILYMLSEPVMAYVTSQDFNGIETVLIPLVLIQATMMVEKRTIRPLWLGLTMALIFQTHMLTVLSSSLALISFFILTWCKTKHALTLWKNLGLSVLLTIALTANVWGTMLNILPQKLIPPVPQDFPSGALYLQDFMHLSVIGPIYTLLMAFLAICGLLGIVFWKRSDALYKVTYLIGLFFLWMSTQYFPWPFVIRFYHAYGYQIQYPKRFLCVGIASLLLATGMLLSKAHVKLVDPNQGRLNQIIFIMAQVILVLFIGLDYKYQTSVLHGFYNQYRSSKIIGYNSFYGYKTSPAFNNELRNSYGSLDLTKSLNLVHQDTADYLPTYKTIQNYKQYHDDRVHGFIQQQFYGLKGLHDLHKRVSHNKLTVSWNQKKPYEKVALPMVKYRDTQVTFNHHVEHHTRISRIGAVYENPPAGKNTLSIQYQVPNWLRFLIVITVLSWLSVLLYVIYLMYINFGRYIPM